VSRLDQEPSVIALAAELGLRGDPVEAVIGFCHAKIDRWVKGRGGVASVADLESLVTEQLQLTFEELFTDEDLERMIAKYVAQREPVFASLRHGLDSSTFGTTIRRRSSRGASPKDKYVAVIDCRGEKGARRFFTRWHEIAHLLVLERELDAPVRRSTDDPLEQVMDSIAGRIGFYEPIFAPILARRHGGALLSFATIDAVRKDYCDHASFQATLFACQRRLSTPLVYVEAEMKYKAEEERRLRSSQKRLFEDDPPVAKLRVPLVVPNEAATDQNFRVMPNMRVPETSVIHQLHEDASREEASGEENLRSWEFSDGKTLPDCRVWIEAKRAGNRVFAIIQPLN